MTRRLHPSRLPLLAAGALLAAPLLGGCGFDYATDRVNTISAGVNERGGDVDVLGAVVIAGQDDVGVFAATLVNNDRAEESSLESVALGEELFEVEQGDDSTVVPGGRTSLFDTGGVEVSGDFGAGSFVDVTLTFSTGQVTTATINVVTPCRQYSPEQLPGITLPPPPIDPGTGTEAPAEEPAEETEESAEGEAHGEDLPDEYSCEIAAPVEHGAPEE